MHVCIPLKTKLTAPTSLPGIMNPVELECKDADGNIVPYLAGGLEWVDGSITADIPTKRLRELFNTNSFIVSQVNPHIVPFVKQASLRSNRSFLRRLQDQLASSMKSGLIDMANLGLIPRLFRQDVSSMFAQRFSGNVTIKPVSVESVMRDVTK